MSAARRDSIFPLFIGDRMVLINGFSFGEVVLKSRLYPVNPGHARTGRHILSFWNCLIML